MPQAIDYEQLKSDIEAAVEFQVDGMDAPLILDANHLGIEEGRFNLGSEERRLVAQAVSELYGIPFEKFEMAEDEPLTELRSMTGQDYSAYRLLNDSSADPPVVYCLARSGKDPDDLGVTD
ncbi:MAG: hypothetical protein WD603_03030 [Patescibacteria group bacterium]